MTRKATNFAQRLMAGKLTAADKRWIRNRRRREATAERTGKPVGYSREHRKAKGWGKSSGRRRRRRRLRRNPQELVQLLGNPRSDLAQAVAKATEFHGRRPRHVTELPGHGPSLISLGPVEEIVYRAQRDTNRRRTRWKHKFGKGARLCTTADGKHLVILGGARGTRAFRVDFDRGIVG